MRPDRFILALIIFSFVIASGVLIFANSIDLYDTNVTTDKFSGVYNTINETYSISQEIQDDVLNAEIDDGTDAWESMIKGSYKGIKVIGSSWGLFGEILNYVVRELGVPPMVINFVLAALSISIIFGIIYLVFRVK